MRARCAPRFGLFSFSSGILALGFFTSCAAPDPHAVAVAADTSAKVGIYEWLADHDPSALRIVGLDAATVGVVAPDARTTVGNARFEDCARARRAHALLAAAARVGTAYRDRLADCGYPLFHDAGSIVIAPR